MADISKITLPNNSSYDIKDAIARNKLNVLTNNKADKTVATTSTDGLMSAEDKVKLDAFEITTTGGKLHDKDIATTDLIPTTLPANGGDADTVGGKSPSDFLPFQAYAPIYTGDIKDISNMGTYSCYKGNCTNLPDIRMWAYVIMLRFRDAGYKTFLCIEFNPESSTQHCRNIYIAREYDVDNSGNMIWYKACDGGDAATVNGRSAFRIPTLDSNGNLWDASAPNVNDLYAQWDASKQYFKLKTFGGNNVAVDIATSNTASLLCAADGTITGLSNGTAKTVSLPFSPVFVLFHSNGHVVQGGFALSCGTNSFTITPANVSTMGSTAVGYIAFGG